MAISQMENSRGTVEAKSGPRGGAQFGARERGSIMGEADQAGVECGIPQCRKQQAVVHVEALYIVAFGPRNDVGGAQQSRIADAGDRAAASPVVDQGAAEDVLTDALDDEPLGLGGLRQAGGT